MDCGKQARGQIIWFPGFEGEVAENAIDWGIRSDALKKTNWPKYLATCLDSVASDDTLWCLRNYQSKGRGMFNIQHNTKPCEGILGCNIL